jgi:hypothetical protein
LINTFKAFGAKPLPCVYAKNVSGYVLKLKHYEEKD